MKTLGSNNYSLPIIIEDCTVVVNLSMHSLDFILSCKGKEVKVAFGAEIIAKNISLHNGGLNKDNLNPISHRDSLLDLTNPGRWGYNPQVFMQRCLNYDNANFTQDESSIVSGDGEPSNLNRVTERAWDDIGNEEAETGNKGTKVVKDINGRWIAYLKFDANKLDPFTEDNSKWKDYLEVICTELREAFLKAAGLDMVEKATFDNIYLDYDGSELAYHIKTLYSAIVEATGDREIEIYKFPLLSKDFIESLESGLKYNEYMVTTPLADPLTDPLADDEIQSLINELKTRQSFKKSGSKSRLRDIGISLNRNSKNVEISMEGVTLNMYIIYYLDYIEQIKTVFTTTRRGGM